MTEEMLVRAAIRDELSGPLEEIREELRGVARETDNASKRANLGARSFDRMASGAGRFVKAGLGMAARAAAAGVAALTVATVAGSVKVLQLASDAAETGSAFRTVFKGVSGDVAGYVDRMNKRFGITTAELQRAATTFGVFGKAAGVSRGDLGGFTKDLVGAGLDLASFYNADPTEVFQALHSGLAGEAEPLRQFGIFLSDAAMKSKAATMGLTGELTESQKVMVRQAIIMESLGDAQGDMARTSDGLANKTKALKGRLTEAATTIGTALLPYAEKAANALDRRLGPAVEALPGKLKTAERVIRGFVGAFQADGLDGVVAKLDRMTGAGGRLERAWDKAKSIADDAATIFRDGVAPALTDVATATGGVLSPVTMLDDVLGFLADHTDLVRVALIAYVATVTVAKAVSLGYTAAAKAQAAIEAVKTAKTKASTVATKANAAATAVQTAATKVARSTVVTWLGVKALEFSAWVRETAAKAANTAATLLNTAATKAAALAARVWAAAQWLLNAALTANPIGLVVAAIALLVAGVVLAYKKSDTFRGIVDALWAALKTAGAWLWNLAVTAGKFLLKWAPLPLAIRLVARYADDVWAAVKKAGEWIWDLGGKVVKFLGKWTPLGRAITTVRDHFDDIKAAIDRVIGSLGSAIDKVGDFLGKAKDIPGVGGLLGALGDTATSRARGAGNLGSTLATHASVAAATGARPTITNALVGGGGRGHGSGDHQSGRALDLRGKGLARYGAHMRAIGGYAAFHGSGSGRHLHAVPPAAGDTVHSRAARPSRSSSSSAMGGGLTLEAGAVVVHVTNPTSDVDVELAVARAIERVERDRRERGAV